MNTKKIFLSVVFAIVAIFFLLMIAKQLDQFSKYDVNKKQHIELAGITLAVDVVNTKSGKEQGLSGRKSILNDEGMLFYFSSPSVNNFWMKDMNFPLDIIWISQENRVIHIEKNLLPGSYPQTFGPNENSKYVLEVNGGFSTKNNLNVGDEVTFLP